jgi:ADP-ribosylglycohydrolase
MMLHLAYKYAGDPKKALLAGANAGGENTNRNACLGAVMGAAYGFEGLEKGLVEGLTGREGIERDVDAFLRSLG